MIYSVTKLRGIFIRNFIQKKNRSRLLLNVIKMTHLS